MLLLAVLTVSNLACSHATVTRHNNAQNNTAQTDSANSNNQALPSDVKINAYVDKHSATAFGTISEALAAAPSNSPTPFIIAIAPGDYYEKITITKANITLAGSGADNTRLHYDAYSGAPRPNTNANPHKTWGTSGSATVTIKAVGFTAQDITIANSFDYPANEQLPEQHPDKKHQVQAVAVLTDIGADQALFDRVRITGYQDTLYLKSGRSLLRNSFVSGHVDFIFGGGQGLFWQTTIETRARRTAEGTSKPAPIGYVTAPSTQISQPYGLVFAQCKFTKEPGVANQSMALGRPWHPTTTFADGRYADPNAIGQTVIMNTWMDAHIAQRAWYPMGGTAPNGKKMQFMPEDARFFEYNNHGPGAPHTNNKSRRQLNAQQAADFTAANVLNQWWPNPTPRYYPSPE
ncbi:pectinesterase family protein [Halioxenophilus aromaticivorans]|uniref:Pectinesterase family protein n=1 Tax=Halioxenophilus aromaticivorans TaxID=1306992 RepID=A0AAV3U6Z9_9ALTE